MRCAVFKKDTVITCQNLSWRKRINKHITKHEWQNPKTRLNEDRQLFIMKGNEVLKLYTVCFYILSFLYIDYVNLLNINKNK